MKLLFYYCICKAAHFGLDSRAPTVKMERKKNTTSKDY